MAGNQKAIPDGSLIRSLRGDLSANELAARIEQRRPKGAEWPSITGQTVYNTERTRGAVRVTTLMALGAGLDVEWQSLIRTAEPRKATNRNVAGDWRGFFTELASASDDLDVAEVDLSFSQAGADVRLTRCEVKDSISCYAEESFSGYMIDSVLAMTSAPTGDHWSQPHGLSQWLLCVESDHLMVGRMISVAQHTNEIVASRIILLRADSELLPHLEKAAVDSLKEDPHFPTRIDYTRELADDQGL